MTANDRLSAASKSGHAISYLAARTSRKREAPRLQRNQ
ncbi:MAG: hypothetical protein AVDCRST_MAG91-150 [uncultured Sphingomonadaceae bacterium]|uniref:Uncharacterized protein n=1 Tax=uncultured Sphingomonadaceae bacterium TaxID=169976 RepID=A0A6J4S5Z9_9SPHN|nr:MAG: hypothetical protein AVDCRST_MAG91-150 [uncultured Sphingomonadaceae bacterium]